MNNLIFKRNGIELIWKLEKEELFFQVESVCRLLGLVKKSYDIDGNIIKCNIRLNRFKEYIKELEIFRGTTSGPCLEFEKTDFIPEAYVYWLAMKTNNTISKDFQCWLSFEVIPEIRKNGYYFNNNNDFINKVNKMLSIQNKRINSLCNEIKDLKLREGYND